MAREFAKAFYKSKAWLRCREGYIQSVNGLCERCLRKGKLTPGKILHHKTHLTPDNINDTSVSLNWDNLEFDCKDCHEAEHRGEVGVTRDDVMFDSNGNLVER